MAKSLEAINVALNSDASGLNKGFKKAKESTDKLSGAFKEIQSEILKFASAAAAIAALKKLGSTVTAFEDKMANVSTLVDTSIVDMGKLENEVLSLGGSFGSAEEKTDALYQALSAGVEPAKAVAFVGESAKLSGAALMGLQQAVDINTTAVNAYGMSIEDTNKIQNIFFKTIEQGKVTGEELGATLGNVIPTAAALKVPLEQVGAAVATMTKGGIKADVAVTSLNATLMAVLKPSKEAIETANSLGIEFSKAGIEGAGGLQKWLAILKDKIGDNESAMAKLFGNVRALRATLGLAGTQAGEFKKVLERMTDGVDAVTGAFEKQQATLSNTIGTIANDIESMFIRVALPAVRAFATFLTENQDKITKFAQLVINAFTEISSVIGSVIGGLIDAIGGFIAIISGAVNLIGDAISRIVGFFNDLVTGIDSISTSANELSDYVTGAFDSLHSFISSIIGQIMGPVNALFGPLIAGIKATVAEFANLKDILTGVAIAWGLIFAATKISAAITGFIALATSVQGVAAAQLYLAKVTAILQKALMMSGTIMYAAVAVAVVALSAKLKELGEVHDQVTASIINENQTTVQSIQKFREFKEAVGITSEQFRIMLKDFENVSDTGVKFQKIMQAIRDGKYDDLGTNLSKKWKEYNKQLDENVKVAKSVAKEHIVIKKLTEDQLKMIDALMERMNFGTAAGLEELSIKTKAVVDAFSKLGGPLMAHQGIIKGSLPVLQEIRARYLDLGLNVPRAIEAIISKLEFLSLANQNVAISLELQNVDLTPGIDSVSRLGEVAEATGKSFGFSVDSIEDYKDSTDKTINSIRNFEGVGQGALGFLNQTGVLGDKATSSLSGIMGGIGGLAEGFASKNPFKMIQAGIQLAVAAIDLIKGKSGELKAVERNLESLGDVATELVDKITELAEELGGSGSAERAVAEYLPELMRDVGVTTDNFDEFVNKIRDVGATFMWLRQTGTMNMNELIAETERNYGEAFEELLKSARELGQEGSAAFVGLIKNAEELKLNVLQINQYVEDQRFDAFAGWKDAIKEFGDIAIPMFEEMLHKEELLASLPDTFKAGIEGATQMLTGLGNAGDLTEENFSKINDIASQAIEKLKAQGIEGSDAIIAMAPLLQKMAYFQREFGLTVDESTQKMIDQGIEQGLISADFKTAEEEMTDAVKDLRSVIVDLANVLKGGVTEGFEMVENSVSRMVRNSRNELLNLTDTVQNLGDSLGSLDGTGITVGVNTGENTGLPGFADGTGGFIQTPKQFVVHSDELVTTMGSRLKVEPLSGISASEANSIVPSYSNTPSSTTNEFNFNINSLDPRQASDIIDEVVIPMIETYFNSGNSTVFDTSVVRR